MYVVKFPYNITFLKMENGSLLICLEPQYLQSDSTRVQTRVWPSFILKDHPLLGRVSRGCQLDRRAGTSVLGLP